MNKLKKVLVSVLSIFMEYATLVATIAASIYIAVSSQFVEYSLDVLALWIISLLGLIAVSITVEKFLKLNKIENGIEKLLNVQKTGEVNLDNIFFSRRNLAPLEERLKNAKKLTLTGGSLARLSDEYYGFFEQKLKEGCLLETIMTAPKSEGAKQLCLNTVYEMSNCELYDQKILESLRRFASLQEQFPQQVKILLTQATPPFSLVAMNYGGRDSFVQVELYSYAVPTRERAEFVVRAKDKNLYDFFGKQLQILREKSQEYIIEETGL